MENEISAQTNITKIAEGDNLEETLSEVKQTPEQNREFAKIRREQEKEKFKDEITTLVTLKTANEILGVNPYNSKKFLTIEDYNHYLSEKNKNTKNSNDESNELKAENKQNDNFLSINDQNAKKNEKNNDFSAEWFYKDKQDFLSQNPEFDEEKLVNLLTDEDFCEFAQGKVGKVPLGEIYNDYNFLLKKVEIMSQKKAHQMYLKKFSSPGSLAKNTGYNGEKVWSAMSEQEFENAIKNAKNGMYKNN